MNAINMQNKVLPCLLFLVIGIIANGCASKRASDVAPSMESLTDSVGDSSGKNSPDATSLIAYDFVRVLSQVPVLSPTQITLSILPDANDDPAFTEALRLALFKLNYAVRIGDANDSSIALTHEVRTLSEEESGIAFQQTGDVASVYQVNVGDISLRRRYRLQGSGVVLPLTPMEGRGLQGADLVVDDSIFERGRDELMASESMKESPAEADLNSENPTERFAVQSMTVDDQTSLSDNEQASAITGSSEPERSMPDMATTAALPINSVVQDSTNAGPVKSPKLLDKLSLKETVNYRELGRSNHHDILENAIVTNNAVIAFPNDSADLIPQSRADLQVLVDSVDNASDIISVVGTSHGKGLYVGAQKALAFDRAAAVVDALLGMGISLDNIFAEASWSDTYFDEVFPRRAAVVQVLSEVSRASVN